MKQFSLLVLSILFQLVGKASFADNSCGVYNCGETFCNQYGSCQIGHFDLVACSTSGALEKARAHSVPPSGAGPCFFMGDSYHCTQAFVSHGARNFSCHYMRLHGEDDRYLTVRADDNAEALLKARACFVFSGLVPVTCN